MTEAQTNKLDGKGTRKKGGKKMKIQKISIEEGKEMRD
jgi:hypothetical protein